MTLRPKMKFCHNVMIFGMEYGGGRFFFHNCPNWDFCANFPTVSKKEATDDLMSMSLFLSPPYYYLEARATLILNEKCRQLWTFFQWPHPLLFSNMVFNLAKKSQITICLQNFFYWSMGHLSGLKGEWKLYLRAFNGNLRTIYVNYGLFFKIDKKDRIYLAQLNTFFKG